ncbi:MAG: hypothetical protein HEQ33_22770 [Dolichospermum sp. WA123]|jgi:hypothetical protein|nr:hypothetical protein [Dolichospermum sp. WA123]
MNLLEKSPEILHFTNLDLDFFCYLPDNFIPRLHNNLLTSSLHFISKGNSDVYIIIHENVIYVVINLFFFFGGDIPVQDILVIFSPCPSIPNDILNTKSRLSNEAILYILSESKENKKRINDIYHTLGSNSQKLYNFLLETGNTGKHLYYHVDALNIILPCLKYWSTPFFKPLSKTFINQNIKDKWSLIFEGNIKINEKPIICYLKKVARKFCCFTGFDSECIAKEYRSKILSQSQKTNKSLKYNDLWFFEPSDYAHIMEIIISHIRDNLEENQTLWEKKVIEKIEHKWGEMSDGRIWIKVEGIHFYSEDGYSTKYIDYSNPSSWPEDMQSSIRDD